MTDDSTVPKIRLVKCPRCRNLLPEPAGVPIYCCGGCGAYLQAKNRKSGGGRATVDLPNDAADQDLSRSNKATKQFEAVSSSSSQESDRLRSPNEIAASEDSSNADSRFRFEEEEKEPKENGSHIGAGTESRVVALGSDPNVINESIEEENTAAAAAEEDDSDSNQTLKTETKEVDRDSSYSAKTEAAEDEEERGGGGDEEETERLGFNQSMEIGDLTATAGSISIAKTESHGEDDEAEVNGCFSNQSLQIEEDTAAATDIAVPHPEPEEIEEKDGAAMNHDDEAEAEAEAAAGDKVSSQSSSVSAEETVRERACQETAMITSPQRDHQFEESTSFAMEQFQNLDTYVVVGAKSQEEPNKIGVAIDVYGEETFASSEEEKKLREELLMLNQTAADSVSEMLMIKGLDPVSGRSHPPRYRTLSESYDHELQWGPRYGEGPSDQEPDKLLYSSSFHSEQKSDYYPPPQDKAELLRIMVLQLEDQVRKMRDSRYYSSEQHENNSVETNQFYSGTLNRPRNRLSQFQDQYQSSGFSSPQPRRYYSPSPTWDLETMSDDQQFNNSKFSYQRERRVHVAKRHIRAVAGGSPVITCYRCSAVLQLPEDFLLSKRKRCHRLKCGSCSAVLRFSLQNGTHIVPNREGGGPENGKKEPTEAARRRRGSVLHKLMGYSSVTQLVIGSGESSPS